MTAAQRRVVFAVSVIVGLSLLTGAGLAFLVSPMAEQLSLGDDVVEDLLAIPSVASLVVVFSAGRLGDRLGHRRALLLASLAYSLGALILFIAASALMAQVGLAICAIAAVTIQIVSVGLIQQTTVGGPAQVSAFTAYGMVFPLAFLIIPVATAGLLQLDNWRVVPLIWAVAGVVIAVLALSMLEREPRNNAMGEWLSPLLAGITLAAVGRALAEIDNVAPDPLPVVVAVGVAVAAAAACVVVMRIVPSASFSFTVIRGGMTPLLLIGVGLVAFVGLLTFVSIALEYLYDLSPEQAALAIVPAQISGVIGARFVARWAITRFGGVRASRLLLLALGFTMLPLLLVQATTPVWLLVAIATVFSAAGMAALTAFNTEVMRRSPPGQSGTVSSFRSASSALGAALGVGVLGTLLMSSLSIDAGIGAVSSSQAQALADNLRLVGLISTAVVVAGWLLLTWGERRVADPPATPPQSPVHR